MKPVAVVFDLYGTLLDIVGLRERAAPYTANSEQFVQRWRDRQLALAFGASHTELYENFDELTARALDETADRLHVVLDEAARTYLLNGWTESAFYTDVKPTIAALKKRGFHTAVLTNGTARSARMALDHAGILDALDVVLTADTVEGYKPDESVYRMALDYYNCAPADIVFVSSNDWDASGAARIGFRSIWCNRGASGSRRPERTITDLDQLIAVIDSE